MKDKRLLIIFLTVFIDLVGFGIIIPMNPYLAREFGATPLQVGLLMSVYSLMQFIFSPFWGQLSDRIGRRPVILISLAGAAIAHFGFACSTAYVWLIVARMFAGIFGGNLSTAMAYIADITAEKDRSKGMGLIGAAFGLGFILGPALGGIFAGVGTRLGAYPPLGESFPAVIAAAICALNFVFACFWLPESRDFTATAPQRHGRFKRIFSALGTPTLNVLMLLLFVNTFALAHVEASLFLYVQSMFSWSLERASFGFAYIGIIMVITQGYLIRKYMPKFGERKILVAGLALSAVGFGIAAISGPSVALLGLGVTFLGFGNGLANPSLNGSISLLSGREVQGANLGVSQSLSSLARILGPPTGGLLYEQVSKASPFVAASALMLFALLSAWAVRAKMPEGGKAH